MEQTKSALEDGAESPSSEQPPAAQYPLAIVEIALDAASPIPLYQQLCRAIAAAIGAGDLPRGGMLPPAQELAGILGVGRHTVLAAYSRLAAEGYTVSNRRRGTRVSENAPCLPSAKSQPPLAEAVHPTWDISFRAYRWLEDRSAVREEEAQRALHAPDPSLYPRVVLGRLLTEEFCRPPAETTAGIVAYQTAVASLLRQMRGVNCAPEQIIPLQSFEHALDLVVRVLIDPGHSVYVEVPAPAVVGRFFRLGGAHVLPIPSDGQGPDIAGAKGPPPRLIFVSPSLGFPAGRQISNERRENILAAARESGGLVFECDRYWELALSGRQMSAMQGREHGAPVLYFGSFSETLGPHVRAAYLVVPSSMVDAFAAAARGLAYGMEPFVLTAIAKFVEGNFYTAHIKNLRYAYADRLSKVAQACRAFIPQAQVQDPAGGFSLALRIPGCVDEEAVCRASRNPHLSISPLSTFYPARMPGAPCGVVLGLGALPDRLIEPAVKRLSEAIGEAERPLAAA